MNNHHFLLISLSLQSHVNPTLQLAKILARTGARVTFATTVHGLQTMNVRPSIEGLSYASFSDGFDDDKSRANLRNDFLGYLVKSRRVGSQNLTNLIKDFLTQGHPVTFIVYTVLIPWVAEVARDHHVPSAFLAIQSATAFAIYQHFFNSKDGLYNGKDEISPSVTLKLPGVPLLTSGELPSFLFPSDPFHPAIFPTFREHIQTLEKDPNPCIIINSFDALEKETIQAIRNINVVPIGPLILYALLDGNDLSDKSFTSEMFQSSKDCLQWLDSKPDGSVVYVSFGSIGELRKNEKEEILHGLVESGRPFLLVIRNIEEELKAIIETSVAEEQGLIVPWCSQMEVLCHGSIGCFVTHCGWNSTLESLVAGVPMVCCATHTDQLTNAKMLEEVWRMGVKARKNEEQVVNRAEIERCLDIVMGSGERGEEIRRNAVKWKELAREAVKEGGSSHNHLKQFLEGLK